MSGYSDVFFRHRIRISHSLSSVVARQRILLFLVCIHLSVYMYNTYPNLYPTYLLAFTRRRRRGVVRAYYNYASPSSSYLPITFNPLSNFEYGVGLAVITRANSCACASARVCMFMFRIVTTTFAHAHVGARTSGKCACFFLSFNSTQNVRVQHSTTYYYYYYYYQWQGCVFVCWCVV